MFTLPGTTLPNGAIVIDATMRSVFAIIPENRATPWVVWAHFNPSTGDTGSGEYLWTFEEATAFWASRKTQTQ